MSIKILSSIDGLAAVNGATVTGAGGAAVPLAVLAGAGQTGNLQEWQDGSGTAFAWVTTGGVFTGSGTGLTGVFLLSSNNSVTGTTTFTPSGTAGKGVVVKGRVSQTANLQEWQSSTSAILASVSPAGVISGDGSGLTKLPKAATFLLGIGTPATTGTDKTNHLTATAAGTITKVWLNAKTGPTGADLIVDILLNGTSIWATTTANRAKIAAGSTTGNQTAFDTTAVSAGDVLTISIIQVGSTVAGQDVTVQLVY